MKFWVFVNLAFLLVWVYITYVLKRAGDDHKPASQPVARSKVGALLVNVATLFFVMQLANFVFMRAFPTPATAMYFKGSPISEEQYTQMKPLITALGQFHGGLAVFALYQVGVVMITRP